MIHFDAKSSNVSGGPLFYACFSIHAFFDHILINASVFAEEKVVLDCSLYWDLNGVVERSFEEQVVHQELADGGADVLEGVQECRQVDERALIRHFLHYGLNAGVVIQLEAGVQHRKAVYAKESIEALLKSDLQSR